MRRGGGAGTLRQLGQDVAGARVVDALRGVQAQAIEVDVAYPVAGVLRDELAHARAAVAVEVDRLSPVVLIAVGEVVRTEAAEIIAVRPEVVVDHVQDHRQPDRVGGIDQALEGIVVAVAVEGRIRAHAVVAPVPASGKLVHRHDLQDGDPQIAQVRELADRRIEGALGGEGADVDLVDDLSEHRDARPVRVGPAMRVGVDQHRRSVRTFRLVARAGIGIGSLAVQAVAIARTGSQSRHEHLEVAAVRGLHCDRAAFRILELEDHAAHSRCPHPEAGAARVQDSAQLGKEFGETLWRSSGEVGRHRAGSRRTGWLPAATAMPLRLRRAARRSTMR